MCSFSATSIAQEEGDMTLVTQEKISCGQHYVPYCIQFQVSIDVPELEQDALEQELRAHFEAKRSYGGTIIVSAAKSIPRCQYVITFAPKNHNVVSVHILSITAALERIAGRIHDALEQQRVLGMVKSEP